MSDEVPRKAATPQARPGLFVFPRQMTRQSTQRIGRETQRASSSSYVSYSLIFLTQGSEFCLPKAGLFTATVAVFIIETYKQLSPDAGTTSFFFLQQISHRLSTPTNSSSSFHLTPSALWLLSLTLSLICALAATLVQQRNRAIPAIEQAQAQTTLHERARMRESLLKGVQAFHLYPAVAVVPALLT